MMTTDERKDHCRDRNLQNIGREYTLPADPPQQRMARWRQLPAANLSPVDRGSPSIRFVRRHGRFALATSGVAAAVLASIFWFSVGGSTPVSAATIFSALKAALQQGVTIRLEQIDLGNAVLDGEVIVQRAGEGQPLESQTFFSELGVTLMSDNPAWDDFQALSVVCRTPSDAWWFVRGAGGSARGINQIVQAEDLYHGLKWQRFGDDPLVAFGPIPLELSFWSWFSRVHYRFTEPQRRYVRGLLRFVHDLSAPESAADLINQLGRAAGSITLQMRGDGMWLLSASRFEGLAPFDDLDSNVPNLDALLGAVVCELQFDEPRRKVTASTMRGWEPLSDLGISIDRSAFDEICEGVSTVEELADRLREQAREVEVIRGAPDGPGLALPKIRVVGYPWPLEPDGLAWAREMRAHIRRRLELAVLYDPKASVVLWAELRNVAPDGGRIRLELGDVSLDSQRLDAETWITERTTIHADS